MLNKDTDYALRVLIMLSADPATAQGYVSTTELARRDRIPLHFLRRVVRRLIAAGYLVSREGVRGGVRCVRCPEKVSVGEIIELFQGRIQMTECMFRKRLCHNRDTCVLRRRIKVIEDKVAREFAAITIADLVTDIRTAAKEKKNEEKHNQYR